MWRVYGERMETGDLSGTPRIFQRVNIANTEFIWGFRYWVVAYGAPTLTGLRFELCELNGDGSAGAAISASAKKWNLSQIKAQSASISELYTKFDKPLFLRGGDSYAVVPMADTYTADASNHIALVRAWPDSATGYSTTYQSIMRAPLKISFIGAGV